MIEKIKALGDKFIESNIAEGYIYMLIKLPPNWSISNKIKDEYKVKIVPEENKRGLYFVTEIDNGFDAIFDAINFVIKYNEQLEKRIEMLNKKISELKELFSTLEIEELETFEFKYKRKEDKPLKRKYVKKTKNNNIEKDKQNDIS